MKFTRVPNIPVCYKAGIAPYPCSSLPSLRKEIGNWLCDEHYFQAKQKSILRAAQSQKGGGE